MHRRARTCTKKRARSRDARALKFFRRHSLALTDLGQKGACNQGKEVLKFNCVSSQALRLLCYWRECSPVGAISVELCSMVKCALWGLRGRTPYKVMQGPVCILAFFYGLLAVMQTSFTVLLQNQLFQIGDKSPLHDLYESQMKKKD